ncbi:heat shock protein DnaJ domain protein [Natrinema pellirubrum DSM 15624]|uniref:DnaJ-class molecular chaperone with C-terminal Zn finger domain n=1 Tax=Natrinema pellirubrum (strain DSM 15624 / CIP 106293 / JCM 10476 / NCIMB 786 / 157) TaxID=797303 RepID=L0JKV4_NATP1|nr:DnaJ domain-containing protein [Natrinema pellirubrum]AGB32165.1 DnaJ-class molecular chaperone with C-terminal Zn finger domain [Natrinema pellirubrum DSM 15624]ELY76950.1 heat shock protein DnaJ domain protein [Natrinema pellirubrum DSM 15624]
MGETYYEVLEVDPDATADEIESAYRDRVLETHPDHSDAPDAAERFQRVQTARSVLTDGDERARYDRLGHEAYVRLADGTATDDAAGETADTDGSGRNSDRRRSHATGGRTNATGTANGDGRATTGTGAGGATTGRRTSRRTDRARGSANTTTADGTTDRTSSHHARQRSRRRQQRATRQATGDWPFGADDEAESNESAGSTESDDATADDGFSYSVHGWDDEIDLEWESRRIDGSTATSVGAVAVLYPLLVWASLTPFFSLPVNAVLAGCTLALVGYLLTMPRLAIGVFGGWSVLFPLGIAVLSPVGLGSLFGLFALGFVWIPLGYAVVLWWVLQP